MYQKLLKLQNPQKVLYPYEKAYAHKTAIYSSYNPDMIEEAFLSYMKNNKNCDIKVDPSKYKIKFTIHKKEKDNSNACISAILRIMKVTDQ